MRIKVTHYGLIHYHAGCRECDFNAAIHTAETLRPADVRNAVRKHVRKTGHTVWIESGSSTNYEAEQ